MYVLLNEDKVMLEILTKKKKKKWCLWTIMSYDITVDSTQFQIENALFCLKLYQLVMISQLFPEPLISDQEYW